MEVLLLLTTLVVNTKTMELESVKLRKEIVDKVRKNKEKTRVPIGAFIEDAIEEKLKNQKATKNEVPKRS